MNINENLITEARRYCIENFDYWFQRYSNERKGNSFPYNYTKHDYNLFPRYLILSKIREEVETVIEEEFDSIADCKTKLIDLSYSCDTNSKSKNKVESKAIQDEKDKFSKFINSLNEEDLYYVEPLPYRRKLTDIQSTEYRVRLLERWKFDGGYWIPLTDDCPEDSIWFSTENLTTKDISQIREFLLTNSQDITLRLLKMKSITRLKIQKWTLSVVKLFIQTRH